LSNDSLNYKDTATPTNGKDIDDDESANEDGGDEQTADGKRKKKARTTFTGRQIFELEKQFEVKKYLSSSERSEMAKLLNVTETQVSHGTKEWKETFSSTRYIHTQAELKHSFEAINSAPFIAHMETTFSLTN